MIVVLYSTEKETHNHCDVKPAFLSKYFKIAFGLIKQDN